MKCVIIDDDPHCISALVAIIESYCPQMNVVGKATTIQDAIHEINATKPELVFLDVEIHGKLGFELFSFFSNPEFRVVFTTAHEKYALQAIKQSCYDYLLKPISAEELVAVIGRLESENTRRTAENLKVLLGNLDTREKGHPKIAIPLSNGYSFIEMNKIVLLEADGKYTKITTSEGEKFLSSKNLGEFESLLPAAVFFRTHKSWLVNAAFVKHFDKNSSELILEGNLKAEVSLRKREEFMKLFNKF
ncbi:MAG: response regulator transcription factor [Bacteroidetes bacterium]|nr:response regulator transcription factor [Bacteroidota bacterium]